MPNRFAFGRKAFGFCDRCNQRTALHKLKDQIIKGRPTNLLVCRPCLDQDHPQLRLGQYPVEDPQALRNPREDTSYLVGGNNAAGFPTDGSRVLEWGWRPVGGPMTGLGLPNRLAATAYIGTVEATPTLGDFLFADETGDALAVDDDYNTLAV